MYSLFEKLLNDIEEGNMTTNSHIKTNYYELDGKYIYELLLPGYCKDDFKINVRTDEFVITVDKEVTDDKKVYGLYQFNIGSNFKKKLSIPKYTNAESLKAKYDSGILTITLEKDTKQDRNVVVD